LQVTLFFLAISMDIEYNLRLMNAIVPKSIPKFDNKSNLNAWQALANVNLYLAQCKKLNMNTSDLFDPQDLVNGMCLTQVAHNLFTLAKKCEQLKIGGPIPQVHIDTTTSAIAQIDIKAEIQGSSQKMAPSVVSTPSEPIPSAVCLCSSRNSFRTSLIDWFYSQGKESKDDFHIEVEIVDIPASSTEPESTPPQETTPLVVKQKPRKKCACCSII